MKCVKTACLISMFVVFSVVSTYAAQPSARINKARVSSKGNKSDIPHQINYQGCLKKDETSVTAKLFMTFGIYATSTGGTALWEESDSVDVKGGIFNVILGSKTPIPASVFTSTERWLQMKIDTEVLSPRTKLTSIGYSFTAGKADSADYATTASYADSAGTTGPIDYADSAGVTGYAHSADSASVTGYSYEAVYADSARVAGSVSGTVDNADKVDGHHYSSDWEPDGYNPDNQPGTTTRGEPTKDEIESWGADGYQGSRQAPTTTGRGEPTWNETDARDYGRSGVSTTLYEGTTPLNSKYLGISAKAADADKLDNVNGSAYCTDTELTTHKGSADHDGRYYTESELNSGGTINNSSNPVTWTRLKNVPTCFSDGVDNTGGSGTVTSVESGNGLTGGPITTTGTLDIGAGTGISVSANAVSATLGTNITSNEIVDGTIQQSDIGFSVGDITGVSAGDGLTGGGSSGSVTLDVGEGTGISVSSNAVSVKYGSSSGTACQGNDSRLWDYSSSELYPKSTSYGVGIGTTNPNSSSFKLHVIGGSKTGIFGSSSSADAIVGKTTASNMSGVYGDATASGAAGVHGSNNQASSYGVSGGSSSGKGVSGWTTTGFGVYGEGSSGCGGYFRSSSNFAALEGRNLNSSSGCGIIGSGGNQNASYVSTAGGCFTGKNYGVYGRANATSGDRKGGYFKTADGYYAYVAAVVGGTNYKIKGTGNVSTVMSTREGKKILFAPESPEPYFEDFGQSQLINGHCHIELDPLFSDCIKTDAEHSMKVFIQLNDDCNGVYVKTGTIGFDVYELQSGTSNASFTYRVIANRKDTDYLRFPADMESAKGEEKCEK